MFSISGAKQRRTVARLAVGAALLALPSLASAGSYGYVWADDPTAASYTPSLTYQANSTGKTNTITRSAPGLYQVTFPGLARAGNGGTVDVTAYGDHGRSYCGVVDWGTGPRRSVVVDVRCADSGGALVDSRFTASYAVAPAKGSLGYVWADDPTSAASTPAAFYQFNSNGRTNTITHTSVGAYTVRLPGLGADRGTVKVTTYGPVSTRCKVGGWGASGPDELVTVFCFNSAGIAVDSRFTMTYANKRSLLGSNQLYGYAWGDQPSAASYAPSTFYAASKPGGPITINRIGPGLYIVNFAGLDGAYAGDVQVTAYGDGSEECRVGFWYPDLNGQSASVECYDTGNAARDTTFTVQYLR